MAFKRWLNYPGKVFFFFPSTSSQVTNTGGRTVEIRLNSDTHPENIPPLCRTCAAYCAVKTPVTHLLYLLYLLSVECRGVSSISSLCASSWMISDDWILQRILRFTLSFSLSSLQPDEHQTNKDTNEVRLKFTCREKTSKLQTSRLNFILYWTSAHLREWINNSMQ